MSWWTDPAVQRSYASFTAAAAREYPRMACDPNAAKISSLISLKGSTAMSVPEIRYAVNASGEAA